ncbi:MAG TPA: adenosylcobalamin-dependent ribonucleoside-diphosphate reductase [Pirellulales bacterium]|nr:adenosylcobalamin-dependent ribonucleoside-diphosphate reductase [Pirellulales bacterium]
MKLSDNARKVLEARYLRRDDRGNVVEDPDELCRRVARAIAGPEAQFGENAEVWEEKFYELLDQLDFLPNSPTLMNAGTSAGQLSACFVLPVEDSLERIFDSLKLMALVQQSGGGTGFSFSHLRPQGDPVSITGGTASGPVSFMRVFDCATENIRHGGRRRGANMGILRVDHPDIEQFVAAKLDRRSLRNFNLSVAVTDSFMQAAATGDAYALRHPRTGEVTRTLDAGELFASIAQAAWETGDPGLIFLDAINRANPLAALAPIEATNPCGEVPLLPYESCNLGSINLSHMARLSPTGATIDWTKLADTTRLAVRFLDNVIEQACWPAPQIAAMTRANRKIGLGVMGFAELLILLGIPYASERAATIAEELMGWIAEQALAASEQLADERGVFPNWEQSRDAQSGRRVRHATRTSVAPTGTISILAGTSASIEPLFGLVYRREAIGGQTLLEQNPLFSRHASRLDLDSPELTEYLAAHGSLAEFPDLPPSTRDLFRTALEISPVDHLRIQTAFQKHVDNAVSKTINLPHDCTPQQVADIYLRAWRAGLKGITVYRYGSQATQPLSLGAEESIDSLEHFASCDPGACKL